MQGEIQTSNSDAIITIAGYEQHLLLKGVTLYPDYNFAEIVGRTVKCNVLTDPIPTDDATRGNLFVAMCILTDIAQPVSLDTYWNSNGYGEWD